MDKNTKILFCNIGWMEFYQGQSDLDEIQGGGSYVKRTGMGHEVCNYVEVQGLVYGYVQPPRAKGPSEGQIAIERMGGEKKSRYVKNVLVIWTATRPEGGRVVIGWYENATVYRYFQGLENMSAKHDFNNLHGYWIKAKYKDVELLTVDERTLEIPKGKGLMGQANIWYADSPEGEDVQKKVKSLIKGKRAKPYGKPPRTTDPEHNAKVEKIAVKTTQKHYEKLGYYVESVEKDNVGWDLEAVSGKMTLQIEVKGLSGFSAKGGLTPNEYSAFSIKSPGYRLAIVTNCLGGKPNLVVCRYSKERNSWIVDGCPTAEVQIKEMTGAIVTIMFDKT